jgi:hypothetical protein
MQAVVLGGLVDVGNYLGRTRACIADDKTRRMRERSITVGNEESSWRRYCNKKAIKQSQDF